MQAFHILDNWYRTWRALSATHHVLAKRRLHLWHALQPTLAKTPALAKFAGMALSNFPITTSSQIRTDISYWNSVGISHDEAHRAALDAEAGGTGEVRPGIIAGHSTGTSGNKGIFLASSRERAIYMGQSIAKLLSLPKLISGLRVMLFLRANSRLYSGEQGTRLFDFRYCPLSLTAQEKATTAQNYDPHILIAPSHVLAELAQQGFRGLSLQQCFYGAEPLGDIERQWIGDTLGTPPSSIYQATEGFLGFTCRHGRLHLNEDSLEFETIPVAGTNGVQLIVTDLFRTSQPIVRVLMDDFIEIDTEGCSCGFPGRTILPVAGRVQHLWRIHEKIITPRQITNIMEGTLGAAIPWAAHATPQHVTLYLQQGTHEAKTTALKSALSKELPPKFPINVAPLHRLNKENKRNRVIWHD